MPGSERVAWIVRLVKIDAAGETRCGDVMAFERPTGLRTMADLGLTLAEAKQLLAAVQQQIVAEQAADHTAHVPTCPNCGSSCRVKDYRPRGVATLFGHVMIRLPRFRCATCCKIEPSLRWPAHCRPTPELDQLQAHLSALMTYRTAAALLVQMFPIDASKDPETLRRRVLKAGAALEAQAAAPTAAPAAAISVTLDGMSMAA
jgi:transposase